MFDEVIRPLLAEKCASCHGADLASGGLSVEDCAALFRGGDEGPAIVPGNSQASPMVSRLDLALADDEHMPPADYPQLAADEIEAIRDWVDSGARRDATVELSRVPESVGQARHASAQGEQAADAAKSTPERAGCAACSSSRGATREAAGYWLLALFLCGLAGRRRFTRVRGSAGI